VEIETNRLDSIMEKSDENQEQPSASINNNTDGTQHNRWDSWSKLKNSFNNLTKSRFN
jgi:hypothetical protein